MNKKYFCLICFKALSASSMKKNILEAHFNSKHSEFAENGIHYFMQLHENKAKKNTT